MLDTPRLAMRVVTHEVVPMPRRKTPDIRIKRAYEPVAQDDGTRILVDRLWPRGVTKDALAIGHWMKEIGPSDLLRRWFGHDPKRWDEFCRRYRAELTKQAALLEELRGLARGGVLTLVYGARDDAHNNAVVLREALLKAPRAGKKKAPAVVKPAAGASKKKSARVSTRRAASRQARRSPKR
jgi:uncharacterized protein YeaO (DUF488 family)